MRMNKTFGGSLKKSPDKPMFLRFTCAEINDIEENHGEINSKFLLGKQTEL